MGVPLNVPQISNENVDYFCKKFADSISDQHGQKILGHVHIFMAEPSDGKAASIVLNYIPEELCTIENALRLQLALIDWIQNCVVKKEEE